MSGLVGYGNTPVKITTGFNTSNLKEFKFENGNIQLPLGGNVLDHLGNIIISEGYTTGNITFSENTITNTTDSNPINIQTVGLDSTTYNWEYTAEGSFILPESGKIIQSNSYTRTTTINITTSSPTVIWSSNDPTISSVKLLIMLEQAQVSDPTGLHTHSCEAIISARGTNQLDIPVISVFGVVYTYATSLATFTTQRNGVTGIIEVVATLADTTNPAYVSIHSVESTTRGL